ncbi:MAG TPA: hypothetical protein VF175_10210 [Lacipirellula sp.]
MELRFSFVRGLLLDAIVVALLANDVANGQAVQGSIEPTTYSTPTAAADAATPGAQQPPLSAEQAREVEMIRQLARHRGGQPEALAQIVQLASPYGDAISAELLEELAASHRRVGALNLAADARTHLAQRYPNEPLGRRAILWLVRLYASGEVAHARRSESPGTANLRRQLSPRMAAALSEMPTSVEGGPAVSPAAEKAGEQFALYALRFATRAMGSHAGLADDPALAFQRSVAARKAGQTKSSEAFLSPLKHRAAADPWGQCARAEEWLLDRAAEASPKPVTPCVSAEAPPHLDGHLDDPCWKIAVDQRAPVSSQDHAASLPADVRLAYDEEYIYVAVQCQKLEGASYEPDARPRPHDGDVEAHDRVRLLIDVDRDYASWFELVIDCRGWTADRCWGDVRWNPSWYVARGESADGAAWTAEAAIPLDELVAVPPTSGAAWAAATTRLPAAEQSVADLEPAAFSLLLFD